MAVSTPPTRRLYSWAALAQGSYYVVTGAWPILSMATFERVTGPKTDDWLVVMVGALAVAIGVSLLVASGRRVAASVVTLGLGSAIAFAAVDVVFVATGTISKIYLLDGVAELGIIALWLLGGWIHRQELLVIDRVLPVGDPGPEYVCGCPRNVAPPRRQPGCRAFAARPRVHRARAVTFAWSEQAHASPEN